MGRVRGNTMLRNISLCLMLSFTLTACGYTFQGSGSVLPADVKRIAIPNVQNGSTEAGLTTTVTEALREQFERYGAVSVVEETAEADAVLKARITKVSKESRTSSSKTDTALQFDTIMTLAAELRRSNGVVLWRDNNITVSRAFGSTSGVVVTSSSDFASGSIGSADLGNLDDRDVSRGQEQDALQALAEQAARQVYDEAVAPNF